MSSLSPHSSSLPIAWRASSSSLRENMVFSEILLFSDMPPSDLLRFPLTTLYVNDGSPNVYSL